MSFRDRGIEIKSRDQIDKMRVAGLLVGETLQLNHYLLDISPFTHIPHLPGGSVPAAPLVTLTVLAVVLAALGAESLRRRDVPD